MFLLIAIFVFFLVFVIFFVGIKKTLSSKSKSNSYEKYTTVITKPEQILYERLKKAFPNENYTIGYQVALNRLVKPIYSTNEQRYELSKKIGSKSIDFIITNLSFETLFLIELDDSSHNNIDTQKRDSDKNEILKNAGLKLYRFNVKKIPTVNELKKLLIN